MTSRFKITIAALTYSLGLIVGPISVSAQEGLATPFTNCSPEEKTKLRQAKRYLVGIQKTLADDFEINARREGQERRSERQIMRRIEKLEFKCKARSDCSGSTAVHMVVGGNKARICFSDALSFCDLVHYANHEFGHLAHIPRAKMLDHSQRGHDNPDRVYQFGYFAGDLCREDFTFQDFQAADGSPIPSSEPPRNTTPEPSDGIELFPRKDFRGRSRTFSPGEETDRGVTETKTYWNDLRYIGRNNAFSSAKVRTGVWELCKDRDHIGPCLYLDKDLTSFKDNGLNNAVSSIKHLGATLPRTGVYLFRDKEFEGGGKHFTGSGPFDLKANGLHQKISSIRAFGGLWEGCERDGFAGWCHTFSGEKPDLKTVGANNAIRSFRKQVGRRFDGLTLHREVGLRGGGRYLPAGSTYPDLSRNDLRVHNAASSLVVLGGEWEVCKKKNFRDCKRVRGVVRDLKSIGMNNKIMSVRKLS